MTPRGTATRAPVAAWTYNTHLGCGLRFYSDRNGLRSDSDQTRPPVHRTPITTPRTGRLVVVALQYSAAANCCKNAGRISAYDGLARIGEGPPGASPIGCTVRCSSWGAAGQSIRRAQQGGRRRGQRCACPLPALSYAQHKVGCAVAEHVAPKTPNTIQPANFPGPPCEHISAIDVCIFMSRRPAPRDKICSQGYV